MDTKETSLPLFEKRTVAILQRRRERMLPPFQRRDRKMQNRDGRRVLPVRKKIAGEGTGELGREIPSGSTPLACKPGAFTVSPQTGRVIKEAGFPICRDKGARGQSPE